jgi:hypothetical protein
VRRLGAALVFKTVRPKLNPASCEVHEIQIERHSLFTIV